MGGQPNEAIAAPINVAVKNHDSRTPNPIPFLLVHLAALAAVFTGVHVKDLVMTAILYVMMMFGVTAGYHRYFAHRAFKTGRVFQFILAFLAQSSAQRGALWWAAHHRAHHRHSDTDNDLHSPIRKGFFHAHFGWILDPKNHDTDYEAIKDFAQYPELVWLNNRPYLPPTIVAVTAFLIDGWSGLLVGWVWALVACWHATFCINSLAHVHGRQRFVTGDHSRNNWILAIFTLGEGWHNNHHAFPNSARQGFRWWEYDVTYYGLRFLGLFGLVKEFRAAPKEMRKGKQTPGPALLERAANQLLHDFLDRLEKARENWRPPTLEELRKIAARRMPKNPHIETVIEKARELAEPFAERLAQRLQEQLAALRSTMNSAQHT